MAACDINTLLANAQIFANLPPGMWDALELQLLCEIYSNTIGSATLPDYINYSGPPTIVPPAIQHVVVDIDGRQWQFFSNTWN